MMKRILKVVLYGLGILVVLSLVVLVLGYNALIRTVDINDYTSFNDLPVNTWANVELSDEAMCSDGSDYDVYTRRGESDNLIIHFAGGGACWDGATCSQPITITNFSGFYFPYYWKIVRPLLNGIFQIADTDNPFADWSVVYIPYCTADFHIGTVTTTYPVEGGEPITIHHSGRQNVTEALAWIYETFDAPETLLISGESAGAFGSIFWTPTIAAQYPQSDIYQLADGAYLETPRWNEIVNDVWQADTLNNFGYEVGADLVGDAYIYDLTAAPDVTYLHINTLYDGTLIYFDSYLNNATNDNSYHESWSQRMRASMQRIAASAPNYYYFLTDYGLEAESFGTPHTSVSGSLFYEIEEDGTALSGWLSRIVFDHERFSVGEEFLP